MGGLGGFPPSGESRERVTLWSGESGVKPLTGGPGRVTPAVGVKGKRTLPLMGGRGGQRLPRGVKGQRSLVGVVGGKAPCPMCNFLALRKEKLR